MDTNFYGHLMMIRAFAPILGANGGGAILNVISALSWFRPPNVGAYAACKAAAWVLSDCTRLEPPRRALVTDIGDADAQCGG